MSESHDPPPMLDYRPPEKRDANKMLSQAIGVAVPTTAALVALVAGVAFLGFAFTYGHSENESTFIVITTLFGLLLLGFLAWISARLYRNPQRRGLAMGLWIGVGLTILIEGTCFLVNTR